MYKQRAFSHFKAYVRAIFIFILTACSMVSRAQTDKFPYPQIPTILTSSTERGAYLIEHFWDNYDFADTTLVDKEEISEQGFANFIDLLPRFDSLAAVKGIEKFADEAFGMKAPQKVAERFETMVEHYLANPNSPMRNEDLYILFLEAQMKTMAARDADITRPNARLTTAMKNRPGTKAADIDYTTRDGQRSTLYTTDAQRLLLVFYDPECEHCREILAKLMSDKPLCQCVDEGKIKVLAIYTEGNRTLWQETNCELPKEWIVAIDESGIVAHHIYDLPAMPVIYMLDKEKKVIMKDPSVDLFLNFVTTLTSLHQ